jgi:BON domain
MNWWRRVAELLMRVGGLGALAFLATVAAFAEERRAHYDDPFVQVTRGIAECPVPQRRILTESQMRSEAHVRSEHGLRCYLAGRCRLPNSYMYDKDIIARVRKAVDWDGRFADTSVWAEGQRRWVYLKGCVQTPAQSRALEKLVREIDEVESVINELVVKNPKDRTPLPPRSGVW